MKLKDLIGAGDRIIGFSLPFVAAAVLAARLWPGIFIAHAGLPGLVVGIALLAVGIPLWLVAVAQIIANVPQGRLITGGSFAIMLHPIYTAVALLVLPGLGLVFDSWLGVALGLVVYGWNRVFSVREELLLAELFRDEYVAYRKKVLLPWL